MHAYLVCSAGLKLKLHICVVTKAFKHLIMRNSRLAILLIDGHFLAVIGIPAYGALYGALVILYIAVLANNGHSVEIWSIVESEIEMLKEKHEHIDKLPGVKLPDSITFTTDIEETIKNNDILVLAVPSVFTRSTAVKMAPFVKEGQIIVCVAKGIEENTLMTISDVVESEIPCADVAVMCGPSHAEEVGQLLPTTVVAGARTQKTAEASGTALPYQNE